MSTGGSLDDPLFAPDAEGVGDFDEDDVFGRMDLAAFGLPGAAQMLGTSRAPAAGTRGADGPEGYRRRKMEEINAQMDQLLRAARPAPPRRERRSMRERRRREEEEERKRSEGRSEGTTDEADAERRRAMEELTASPPAPRRRAAAAATMPPPLTEEQSFVPSEDRRHPSLDDDDGDGTSFESESPDPLAAAPSRAQLLMSGALPPLSEDAERDSSALFEDGALRGTAGGTGRGASPPAFPHLAPSSDPLSPPSASDED